MTRLAIVGAGIEGCAAAYFARKYLPGTQITIYEAQDRVGGRVLTQKILGQNLELGATFFNGANKTILGIVNTEKLRVHQVEDRLDFAVWNGSNFVFKSNRKAAVTNLKLTLKYGLSTIRTLLLLRNVKRQISQLYQEFQEGPREIDSLFELTGLRESYTKTFDELLTGKGVSRDFVDEVVSPITRTIYSQNADIAAFAGISALMGVYWKKTYSFDKGNSIFPAYLVAASNAQVMLRTKVSLIEKTLQGYRLQIGNDMKLFDGVIIAVPYELAGIEFDNIPKPDLETQRYQTVYTKVMRGLLNPAYFGLDKNTRPPSIILTTKDADPIKYCNIQRIENNESMVTFTSADPISDETFTGVFKNLGVPVLQHRWDAAYPIFKPIKKLPRTRLDQRLIYANSIEASISSMETAATAAKNAVRMMLVDLA
jgi:prenylcysteine oxidase/farnesylcysteine lyase